jgi:hypothetical protein
MSKILGVIKNQSSSQLESETEENSALVENKSQRKNQKKQSKSEENSSKNIEVKIKIESELGASIVSTKNEEKPRIAIVNQEILGEATILNEVAVDAKDKSRSDCSSKFKPKPKPILLTPEQVKIRRKIYCSTIYQAIGRIQAHVSLQDNKVSILFGGEEFPLLPKKLGGSNFTSLKEIIAEQSKDLEIIVYPNIHGENSRLIIKSFTYVRTESIKNTHSFLRLNHFQLSGLWKTIDDCTCIQLHSNIFMVSSSRRLERPLNIPLEWNDCPIQKDSTKDVYVSIEAKFNSKSYNFEYIQTLINPTEDHPPFPRYNHQKKLSKTWGERRPQTKQQAKGVE